MTAITAVATTAVMAAVLGASPAATASPAAEGERSGGSFSLMRSARFAPPTAFVPSDAVTYDQQRVPAGARITVVEIARGNHTRISIRLSGLQPGRTYGTHVHVRGCGPSPEDAGPHYQNRVDPVQPSTDPAYANPENEVWLDFTTDAEGDGKASAEQNWRFRKGRMRSVVLHEHATATGPGEAGEAGARLACYSVPFG